MAQVKAAWTRLALADLKNAHDFIAQESKASAAYIMGRIEEVALALSRYPSMGRSGRVNGTREIVVSGSPFIIAYQIRKERVEILAVIHSSRKWPEAL